MWFSEHDQKTEMCDFMVSIVIPSIGREVFFKRAFLSAIRTSYVLVDEICVVDNSQDESFSLYLSKLTNDCVDSRVVVHTLDVRYGMDESWNFAINQTKNNWVLYLHDDDELIPNEFNKINPELFVDDVSFIAYGHIADDCGVQMKFIRDEIDFSRVSSEIIKSCPKFVSTFINKSVLQKIGGWNLRYGNFLDLVGFLELAKVAMPKFCAEIIGVYYYHDESISRPGARSKGYGDYIPSVTDRCFDILDSDKDRIELLKLYLRYVYRTDFQSNNENLKSRFLMFIKNITSNIKLVR